MNRPTLAFAAFCTLVVSGTAGAETATFRLTPGKTDTQFHTFTIQVERRDEAGAGKVLHVRVAVKRKAGGPGPAWHEGRLDVFDGKDLVSSCAVEPQERDGVVAYTFRIGERFAARSKFTVGKLLGDLDSVYSWFYVGDFAPVPLGGNRGAGAAPITVEELRAGLRKEGFQWKFVGRSIAFRATVLRAGPAPEVRIDGLEKDTLDTAVLHNVLADNNLKVGDRIQVAGLIVDQWYGVWQVWRYELRRVGE